MTENTLLRRIAHRIRPSLAKIEGEDYINGLFVTLAVAVTAPFAIIALIWLGLVTDLAILRDNLALFAALLVTLIVIWQHFWTIGVEHSGGEMLTFTGTFANIVVWSVALLFGPTALWLAVIAAAIFALQSTWQRFTRNQAHNIWMALSMFDQEVGHNVLGKLAGLALYRALGGDYPLEDLAVASWMPAVLAIIAGVLVQVVASQPLFLMLSGELGTAASNMWRWWLMLLGFSIITETPFAILAAYIYTGIGTGVFLLMVAGVALVNYMAFHLSRTNLHSQQRTRELSRLETLGEALIEAPPDLSTLEEILRAHAMKMFPVDRFELRLFALEDRDTPAEIAWPALRLIDNPDRPPIAEDDWKRLRAANQTHILLPDVTPPDVSITYGDALLVPIAADDPGEEGGERERLLGGIALLRHRDNGKTIHSLSALQALASQIGSAHYRASVHQETLTAQKMAQELELAGRIQAKFLPASVPQLAGWDIAAGLTPARQTSGDFYDFVVFEDGRLGMVVADVADKGTGAALYMALSRTLIRTFALQTPDAPESALRAANERLLTDAESDQFVTVFYGVLDPASGVLTYANAGHNPGYILRANGSQNGSEPITALPKTGVPLGILEDMDWQRASVTLNCGDTLVLYTDGVNEAQDLVNAEFGDDRLCDTIRAHLDQPATAIHSAVTHAVQDFVGAAPQFDDITLMIAVRK